MAATRWAALQAAADELGIERAGGSGPFTPKVAQGGAAADGALNAGATAIVAHNDLLAIGVMQRLAQRGRRSRTTSASSASTTSSRPTSARPA